MPRKPGRASGTHTLGGATIRRIFDIDWEAATMIEQCSKCRELAGIE